RSRKAERIPELLSSETCIARADQRFTQPLVVAIPYVALSTIIVVEQERHFAAARKTCSWINACRIIQSIAYNGDTGSETKQPLWLINASRVLQRVVEENI